MRALVLALLALSVSAGETVPALIAGLRDEDPARRDACSEELSRRWDQAHAELERAAAAEKDAEAKAKIESILKRGPAAEWRESLKEALEASAKDGRPVLAIRGDGALDRATTLEGLTCRAMLKSDEATEALRWYRIVWIAEDGVPGTPTKYEGPSPQEGHGGVEFYVVHPKLGVCHYLRGQWKNERFAAELSRGRELARAADLESLRKARAEAFEALRQARAASTCLNVRRHMHPWRCGAEGCTLGRLGLCYVQGDTVVGKDVAKGLPEPMAGGENAALPF